MKGNKTVSRESQKDSMVKKIRLFLLFLSLVFISAGVINGGFTDVWSKAMMICRECIGLG